MSIERAGLLWCVSYILRDVLDIGLDLGTSTGFVHGTLATLCATLLTPHLAEA